MHFLSRMLWTKKLLYRHCFSASFQNMTLERSKKIGWIKSPGRRRPYLKLHQFGVCVCVAGRFQNLLYDSYLFPSPSVSETLLQGLMEVGRGTSVFHPILATWKVEGKQCPTCLNVTLFQANRESVVFHQNPESSARSVSSNIWIVLHKVSSSGVELFYFC